MWNCVDDKKDNEKGRAQLEYLPRGPQVSSYGTGCTIIGAAHRFSLPDFASSHWVHSLA